MIMYKQRPLGIAILAVLEIIGGIFTLIAGIIVLAFSALVEGVISQLAYLGDLVTGLIAAVGIIILIVAILELLFGYGLWNGRGWAWTLQLIFSALGIILSLSSIGLIPMGLITIY